MEHTLPVFFLQPHAVLKVSWVSSSQRHRSFMRECFRFVGRVGGFFHFQQWTAKWAVFKKAVNSTLYCLWCIIWDEADIVNSSKLHFTIQVCVSEHFFYRVISVTWFLQFALLMQNQLKYFLTHLYLTKLCLTVLPAKMGYVSALKLLYCFYVSGTYFKMNPSVCQEVILLAHFV